MREMLAYFRIQAEDRAHEAWRSKMEQLAEKRARAMGGRGPGSMNVPQAPPG